MSGRHRKRATDQTTLIRYHPRAVMVAPAEPIQESKIRPVPEAKTARIWVFTSNFLPAFDKEPLHRPGPEKECVHVQISDKAVSWEESLHSIFSDLRPNGPRLAMCDPFRRHV